VNAGADQSADEGTTVDLSATGADGDGTIASYSWQQESGTTVSITNADMANASIVAPMVAASEVLVFQVTVTDDDGATGSDTVTITVNDTDPPPPPTGDDFIPLGVNSSAVGVSADGSVVVGDSGGAYRWTSAGGKVGLDPDGEFDTWALGVSADGTVVVGQKRRANTSELIEAFRWTSATGIVEIEDLPGGGIESYASAASADGSVVVGRGHGASGFEAFRWTSGGGTVGLSDLPGGSFWSMANAVSADGSVVAGLANANNSAAEAFRWTSASGMVGLGVLPGGLSGSTAYGVSADGSVIVGSSSNATRGEAILWTSAGGMMGLGYLPGHLAPDAGSGANGVSADGSVVVGQSQPDNNGATSEAFVWTQSNGMQRLRDVLIANGVTGLDNWELRDASGISADGQWVVGNGINPLGEREAFLVNISAP
jgi:probable HAF family extracellular repeat protein